MPAALLVILILSGTEYSACSVTKCSLNETNLLFVIRGKITIMVNMVALIHSACHLCWEMILTTGSEYMTSPTAVRTLRLLDQMHLSSCKAPCSTTVPTTMIEAPRRLLDSWNGLLTVILSPVSRYPCWVLHLPLCHMSMSLTPMSMFAATAKHLSPMILFARPSLGSNVAFLPPFHPPLLRMKFPNLPQCFR